MVLQAFQKLNKVLIKKAEPFFSQKLMLVPRSFLSIKRYKVDSIFSLLLGMERSRAPILLWVPFNLYLSVKMEMEMNEDDGFWNTAATIYLVQLYSYLPLLSHFQAKFRNYKCESLHFLKLYLWNWIPISKCEIQQIYHWWSREKSQSCVQIGVFLQEVTLINQFIYLVYILKRGNGTSLRWVFFFFFFKFVQPCADTFRYNQLRWMGCN